MTLEWFQSNWENIYINFLNFLPTIRNSILIFITFWIGGIILFKSINRVSQIKNINKDLIRMFGRLIKTSSLVLGGISALNVLGFDVTALIAGLGLTGFAVGFALKDIISNIISGMLIILYQSIEEGDQVKVSSYEGVVKKIDLRYTVLHNEDLEILVPNSMMFSNVITVIKN